MSYETRAYDKGNDDGFAPDPVLVLVATGTHDVSRLVQLLNGAAPDAKPNTEHRRLADRVTAQLRRSNRGRAALRLLAEHGGPDFGPPSLPGLDDDRLAVVRRLAAGMAVKEIAAELHLSQTGVTMRISRACKAVGARTREQLVAVCAQLGIVEPGPLQGGSRLDGAR